MASSTKPGLSAVVTPALTDIVSVRQSGDTRDKRETLAQVKSLMPSGDVVGPASATDNAVARFDGTGGKTLQDSAVKVSDGGSVELTTALGVVGLGGLTPSFASIWTRSGSTDQLVIGKADRSGPTLFWAESGYFNSAVGSGPSAFIGAGSSGKVAVSSNGVIGFSSGAGADGTLDIALKRSAIGVLKVTDGGSGDGVLMLGGLVFRGRTSSVAGASATELPNDKDASIHKNTSSGAVHLAYNDGGVIKSVALS
jgi:hypothetical protein